MEDITGLKNQDTVKPAEDTPVYDTNPFMIRFVFIPLSLVGI